MVEVITLLSKTDEARRALHTARVKRRGKAAAHREIAAIYECFVTTKQREVRAIYAELESDIRDFRNCIRMKATRI